MRKLYLLVILLVVFEINYAQNLVPNGDFEQLYSCPTAPSQLTHAMFWMQPTWGSSDYYNKCGTGWANIPTAGAMNFQQTHGGAGFTGIELWDSGISNYREYIEVPLDSTLIANSCYHFEMYINLSNNSKYTTDNIGVYFSDTIITGISSDTNLLFTPQINNTVGNLPDTLNWTLVSADYTAIGGEKYITIGNFGGDILLDTLLMNPSGIDNGSYVYIDDVILTSCISSIDDYNNITQISVYPNPSSRQFNFSGLEKENKIEIFDLTGQLIYQTITNGNFQTVNISDKAKGIYFYRISKEMKLIQQGKIILLTE